MKAFQYNIQQIRLQYASRISWISAFEGFMVTFVCYLVFMSYNPTIEIWVIITGVIVLSIMYNIRKYKYTYLDYISTINKNDEYKIQYDWYELLRDSLMIPRKYIIGTTIPIFIHIGILSYILLIDKSLLSQHDINIFINMLINIGIVQLIYIGVSILLNYLYVRKTARSMLK